MACATCEKKHVTQKSLQPELVNTSLLSHMPLNANDIQVYDGETTRDFIASDWPKNRHKLILLYPETFTPVCTNEMGSINKWVDEFDKLNCDIYSLTTDPIEDVKSWYESQDELKGAKYLALSSFLFPLRLGLLRQDRTKRASVIITSSGETITHEHFMNVGRSIKELHRTLHAYTTGSYCGSDWEDPSDGFLK